MQSTTGRPLSLGSTNGRDDQLLADPEEVGALEAVGAADRLRRHPIQGRDRSEALAALDDVDDRGRARRWSRARTRGRRCRRGRSRRGCRTWGRRETGRWNGRRSRGGGGHGASGGSRGQRCRRVRAGSTTLRSHPERTGREPSEQDGRCQENQQDQVATTSAQGTAPGRPSKRRATRILRYYARPSSRTKGPARRAPIPPRRGPATPTWERPRGRRRSDHPRAERGERDPERR
jgi:hypothetical protein